ncbi:hypothetical protein FRC01_002240 [Tulasnella sp. 417]|nr:hypothetical protein FRC01_002240 [Tulasnella sp. 417]
MDALVDSLIQQFQDSASTASISVVMADDNIDDMDLELEDELDLSSGGAATSTRQPETDEEKQVRIMDGYISALPFPSESPEEMREELNRIVSKMLIAAEGRHWDHLLAWTGAFNSWLSLKYPFPRELRASLARMFWEIIFIPSLELQYIHSFASTLIRLIGNRLGSKRKLELNELTLPWARLWQLLELEMRPKKRMVMSNMSRNLHNVLLHLAEACCDYFAPSEIQNMLDTFLPLITKETASSMFTVLAAFLPASHAHKYLPFMFKSWEAFHSYKIEDSMISQFAALSVAHVAGTASEYGPEGSLPWKDVGIYSEKEWDMIMRACLASMSVPVGSSKGGSATAVHADRSNPSVFKKNGQRHAWLAQIIVYSMSVDGPIRPQVGEEAKPGSSSEKSFLAGLITSVETFFHPSNFGAWTFPLLTFVHRLAAEFSTRWNDELLPSCKTPLAQRITVDIKRSFVQVLRTPVLLSMFAKDPIATSYAQAALKHLSILEPDLIMPQLLERAFSGLETVNETHRTTAAIGALAAVPSALTIRSVWLKGQKHLVSLLEMCLPGIDINDAIKTISTSLFITTALQFIKIGDLNVEGVVPLAHDAPGEDVVMKLEGAETPMMERLKRKEMSEEELEEDSLVKQSTAGFADWVVSFFRRVFALYENLPEEGGKSGKTGGKTEETVLKSLNAALDVVCANLSDNLFTLVLNLVYEYCTTNARSNSVRSIGNLVNSMARTRPKETISKFLPFTKRQIEIELAAGASNVRTTSNTAAALPSDTTFHWNLAVIRAALAYGGADLVEFKEDLLSLMTTLRKAKNERGYSGFGRLVNRTLATLTGTYPLEQRIVNPRQWKDPYFERSHHYSWGKQFSNPKDVEVQWHVPSAKELEFAIEIFQKIITPAIVDLEALIQVPPTSRDGVWRNDFCRMMYLVRSAWSGASCLLIEGGKTGGDLCIDENYIAGITPSFKRPRAAFALTDPADPRYQTVQGLKERFGNLLHRSFLALTQEAEAKSEAADAVDASIQLVRALDIYLLDYGVSRDTIVALKRQFTMARDSVKTHPKQRSFPRMVWIKRAALYGYSRMFQHTNYRDRSALDDQLLVDLVELSLSPYTRVRKHAQSALLAASAYYRRAWRFVLPRIIEELKLETSKGKDADPDRQKGIPFNPSAAIFGQANILPVSWNVKAKRRYPSYPELLNGFWLTQLPKPSIQKLVARIISDSLSCFTEESLAVTVYLVPVPDVAGACAAAHLVNGMSPTEQPNLVESKSRTAFQAEIRQRRLGKLVSDLLAIANSPLTHWRYKEYSIRYITYLLCRDHPPPPDVATLLSEYAISEHPYTRAYSQRGLTKLLLHVKMRSFSRDPQQLWWSQWLNPLRQDIPINDPNKFLQDLEKPFAEGSSSIIFVDKEHQGFFTWSNLAKGYRPPPRTGSVLVWASDTQPSLQAIRSVIDQQWIQKFIILNSQEGAKAATASSVDLRLENVIFLKSLFKTFEAEFLEPFLGHVDTLIFSDDKYQQRAGFEVLAGALRGSKHWALDTQAKVWEWFSTRLPRLFEHIKPDAVVMWDAFLNMQLVERDPRRMQPLVDFILSQKIDFNADSAFPVTKRLTTIGILADGLGTRIESQVSRMIDLYFDNIQTPYAEVRAQIAVNLGVLMGIQWHPRYRTSGELVAACGTNNDPLQIRKAEHLPRIQSFISNFDQWRQERLPPPRVSQSTYDRVGLTLLQWVWGTAHSARASSVFPYVMPLLPEIFKMAELNDSSELQLYSSAVLIVLSTISPPHEYVEPIIDNLIGAVKSSPSWRIRLSVLPVLQVFYFRNLLNLPDTSVQRVMEVLLECLRDENVEVRETAAKTLSGVIRCSQRQSIPLLKDTWAMDQLAFNEDQAQALSTIVSGTSYYA